MQKRFESVHCACTVRAYDLAGQRKWLGEAWAASGNAETANAKSLTLALWEKNAVLILQGLPVKRKCQQQSMARSHGWGHFHTELFYQHDHALVNSASRDKQVVVNG